MKLAAIRTSVGVAVLLKGFGVVCGEGAVINGAPVLGVCTRSEATFLHVRGSLLKMSKFASITSIRSSTTVVLLSTLCVKFANGPSERNALDHQELTKSISGSCAVVVPAIPVVHRHEKVYEIHVRSSLLKMPT